MTHAVRENLGTCARDGTETCILENVKQLVKRYVVEFRNADKFNWRESAHLDTQFLREHLEDIGVIAERNFLVDATLQKNLVGAFDFGLKRLLADFVQTQNVRFGVLCGATKTAKAASHFADVRVVHDAKCGVAHAVPGEFCLAHGVGRFDNFCPRHVFQDFEPFGWRESLLGDSFF